MSNRLWRGALVWAVIALPTTVAAQTPVDRRLDVAPDGIVEISNVAGSVEVTAGSQRELVSRGTLAPGVERLDVVEEQGRVRIEVVLRENSRNPGETHLEIQAPPRSELRVETVSAEIDVSGIEGEQRLTTVSGSATTEGFEKDIQLESVSGSLEVNGRNRPFRTQANSVSGRVTLEDVAGEVQAETVSGELNIVADAVTRADLSSVSGGMSLRARLGNDSRINASSTSGSVTLRLLGDGAGEYELSSFSGRVSSCFGSGSSRSNGPQQELRFREGTSAARVEVETMSGRIDVCRE